MGDGNNHVVHDDAYVDDMGYLKDDLHDDMLVDDPGYPLDDVIVPRNADDDYDDDLAQSRNVKNGNIRSTRMKVIKGNNGNNKPDMYDYPYYTDDATVDDVTDDYIVDDGAGGWYSNGYGGDVYYYGFTDLEGNERDESGDRHTL